MIAKLIALLAFSLVFLGFNTDAKAQAGGSAFSGAVTAATGNTNIDVTSSEPITVTNVYIYNTTTNQLVEVPAAQYAIVPGTPAKKPKVNFINGLENGMQYRVKYSWTSSKTPVVTLATS